MIRKLVARAQLAPFELAIALLLVLSGIRFLWKEDELAASQIGQSLPAPQVWAASYLIAGCLVIVGVIAPLARVEAAGLALMASVVAINAVAFAATYNVWDQWAYGVALVFYLSLTLAALGRLHVLVSGGVLVFGREGELIVAPKDDADGR